MVEPEATTTKATASELRVSLSVSPVSLPTKTNEERRLRGFSAESDSCSSQPVVGLQIGLLPVHDTQNTLPSRSKVAKFSFCPKKMRIIVLKSM